MIYIVAYFVFLLPVAILTGKYLNRNSKRYRRVRE
jgi:hypothetical protein